MRDRPILPRYEAWRKTIHQRVGKMASAVAESMGGSCDVKVSPGYPFLHNDEKVTNDLTRWAQEYLGDDKVEILDSRMTAEDFAYFAQRVPSCLFRLGVRDEGQGIVSGLHSTTFDADERALVTGTGLLAWFAINLLKKE